jgi:hypothetical protein
VSNPPGITVLQYSSPPVTHLLESLHAIHYCIDSRSSRRCLALLVLSVACGLGACGHTEASSRIPFATVMQAVRDYGQGSQSPTAKLANAQTAARFDQLYDFEGPYQAHIRSVLAQEDFSRLDAAEEARLSQARLNSGLFRLFTC